MSKKIKETKVHDDWLSEEDKKTWVRQNDSRRREPKKLAQSVNFLERSNSNQQRDSRNNQNQRINEDLTNELSLEGALETCQENEQSMETLIEGSQNLRPVSET